MTKKSDVGWVDMTNSSRWPPARLAQVDALLSFVNGVDPSGSTVSVEEELERIRNNIAEVIQKAKNLALPP